jgi:hypothetical protein
MRRYLVRGADDLCKHNTTVIHAPHLFPKPHRTTLDFNNLQVFFEPALADANITFETVDKGLFLYANFLNVIKNSYMKFFSSFYGVYLLFVTGRYSKYNILLKRLKNANTPFQLAAGAFFVATIPL